MVSPKIAPSLACANYMRLEEELKALESGGADYLHIDVMDGHFVPNFAIGINVLKSIKNHTKLPFEVHLMIDNPNHYIKEFAELGTYMLTFHAEAYDRLHQMTDVIKGYGMKAGIVLNPCTPLSVLDTVISKLDMVTLMTVDPGFSGQKFVYDVLTKIQALRNMCEARNIEIDIAVDGNINAETMRLTAEAGANYFVLGTSSIFKPSGNLLELTREYKKMSQEVVSTRLMV